MLFAVVTAAGTAAVMTISDPAPEVVVHEVADEPVDIALPHRPLVLPTGAPACGNLMLKFAAPC